MVKENILPHWLDEFIANGAISVRPSIVLLLKVYVAVVFSVTALSDGRVH